MGLPLKYFGTDGIRGPVGKFPITVDFILKLGWSIGTVLSAHKGNQKDNKVLIGKDPRISGYMIESALQAGLASAGMKIYLVGPMPTSAIAYLTQTLSADIGIVISASHNSYQDNGIKLFSAKGFKLPESFERDIEAALDLPITTANPVSLGKALRIDDAKKYRNEYAKDACMATMSPALSCVNENVEPQYVRGDDEGFPSGSKVNCAACACGLICGCISLPFAAIAASCGFFVGAGKDCLAPNEKPVKSEAPKPQSMF